MVALIICDCGPRKGPKQTIHFAMIIPLLLQRGLDIGGHLIGRQAIIAVDRAIIGIICIRSVAPSRDPVARIPSIPSTVYENYPVVTAPPPVPVVPL